MKIEMIATNKEIIVFHLLIKIKKDYYNNLDYKRIIDNKLFWKYVKPLFPEKTEGLMK